MPGWLKRGRAGHNRVGFRSKPAKTLSTRARGVGAIRLMVRPAYFLFAPSKLLDSPSILLDSPSKLFGSVGESDLGGRNILVFIIVQLQHTAEGGIKSGRLKSGFFTSFKMTYICHSEAGFPAEKSTFQSPTISLRGGGARSVVREAEASLTKPGVCALMKS